jgi:hypothetical protein
MNDAAKTDIMRKRILACMEYGGTMNNNKTITYRELENALTKLGYTEGVHARRVFDEVIKNREPEWKTGNIVRSSTGNVFTKLENGMWRPETMGMNASDFGDEVVSRPLVLIGQAV